MKNIILVVGLLFSFNSLSDSMTEATENNKLSYQQLLESAKQGDIDAQYKLGFKYELLGFMKNIKKAYAIAFYWYQKAASSGHATAQSKLGKLYAKGTGVSQNIEKAKYWLKQSYNNGDKETSTFAKMIYEQELGYGSID